MFSLTKRLMQGWQMKGDESKIEIYMNDFTVTFDIKIPTKNGFLFAMLCTQYPKELVEENNPGSNQAREVSMLSLECRSKVAKADQNKELTVKVKKTKKQRWWYN
jgi:hypothetical protein